MEDIRNKKQTYDRNVNIRLFIKSSISEATLRTYSVPERNLNDSCLDTSGVVAELFLREFLRRDVRYRLGSLSGGPCQ